MAERIFLVLLVSLFACQKNNDAILLNPAQNEWLKTAPNRFEAEFKTSKGSFILEINRTWAPIGADRFYNLVRNGYYNKARFHRVVKGFIVQFGIAGKPEVSQSWENQFLKDDPVVASNTYGTIAYAFTEPNTRSTQVYINMTNNTRLDSTGFAPFGRVISGMDVIEMLYSGYGENSGGGLRRGDQSKLFTEGNNYLDTAFPLLDRIESARVINLVADPK